MYSESATIRLPQNKHASIVWVQTSGSFKGQIALVEPYMVLWVQKLGLLRLSVTLVIVLLMISGCFVIYRAARLETHTL